MPSTAYFPLHTSVEMFVDPLAPTAVTKAKEAAILFDELVFEAGLLDVTITPTGSMKWWTPPQQLTPETLEGSRRPIPLGSDVVFAVGAQKGPGEPATELHAVISDKMSARFMAEFHTGILDELAEFRPDWVRVVAYGSADPPRSTPVGDLIADLNWADFRATDLMPDADSELRNFVYKAFNHDLAIAAGAGAMFNVTKLFEPMLVRRGLSAERVGATALSLVVPDIGQLPWEAVVGFRDHPGSAEARAMLAEFETRAAQQEPEDAYAWLRAVMQQLTAAYAAALADTMKTLPEELGRLALSTGVGFIPIVGPVAALAASSGEAVVNVMRDQRSWSAALWRLQSF